MPLAVTFTEVVTAWPLAFLLGVILGIVLSSRGYRIVRAPADHANGDEV